MTPPLLPPSLTAIAAPRQTVLVVDDQPLNVALMVGMLESECEVVAATNGAQALRLAAMRLPDLILLNAQMPGMDGFDVCRRLKADPLTHAIPVIFLTARFDEASEAEGLRLGAIDYLHQPVSGPILRVRVRNHLQLVRQRDTLERLAHLDGLTGIANRRAFDRYLEQAWQRMRRVGRPLAVVLLDVDCFKPFNDALGHLQGDACLREVAQLVQQVPARSGLCARYGGEEFAYVLPETDAAGAATVGERLRAAVAARQLPHPASTVAAHVTVSVGGAAWQPAPGRWPADLLAAADRALYAAKHQGRDRVVVQP